MKYQIDGIASFVHGLYAQALFFGRSVAGHSRRIV
jgi:hypothetical protein